MLHVVQRFKAPIEDLHHRLPLRWVLVVPFVLQIFTAVSLTGFLSLQNGQKAVNDLITQLNQEVRQVLRSRMESLITKVLNRLSEN